MTHLAGSQTPRHILSREEAQEIIQPYKEKLDKCIQAGWDAWTNDYQGKHHILDARARAAIVFAEIRWRVQQEFSGLDGVIFKAHHNSFMLYIGESISIRFKKLRKNGRCSAIDTRQQMLFKAQAQLRLPTMLHGTLVNAGYVLDDLQQGISRKLAVCQFKNQVLWQLTLEGAAAPVLQIPVTTPTEPPKPKFEINEEKRKEKENKAKAAKAGEKE
jgi:hypothetical protein